MIEMKFSKAKNLFFDRPAVQKRMDAATRRVLSKAGAFVRKAAQGSIKKRKKVSDVGAPPSSHTGILKDSILFIMSKDGQSVVIGPTLLNHSDGKAPKLLEHGGTRIETEGRRKVLVYRPRPFMKPAMEKEAPKFPGLFKNTL